MSADMHFKHLKGKEKRYSDELKSLVKRKLMVRGTAVGVSEIADKLCLLTSGAQDLTCRNCCLCTLGRGLGSYPIALP